MAAAIAASGERRRARGMGSTVEITVLGGPPGLADRALERLGELERRWTRFRDDSELSQLNAADGEAVHVHRDTVELVVRLVQAWRVTGGAFDPTVLPLLVDLGDVASREDPDRCTSLAPGVHFPGDPEAVRVDLDAGVVQLPPGTTLDAGGLGKGLAADLVSAELIGAGASGALVSVGGDLRARGEGPDGSWVVAVEDPHRAGSELTRLAVVDGGVATSSTIWRRWEVGREERHHLIDPRLGRPAANGVVAATVIAGDAAWAEAWTKVLMVHRPADALDELEARGLGALVVGADGAVRRNAAWERYAR